MTITSVIVSCDLHHLYYFTGPIASALISIFGFRPVAMVGAGLSALGIFLSTWSPNVQTMILLFGVAGGKIIITRSISYLPISIFYFSFVYFLLQRNH